MMNKETIKEFLKPDWRKKLIITILSVSLFFGLILIYEIRAGSGLRINLSFYTFMIFLVYIFVVISFFYFISGFAVFYYNKTKDGTVKFKSGFINFLFPDWRKLAIFTVLILVLMVFNLTLPESLLTDRSPFTPDLVPFLSLPPYCQINCLGQFGESDSDTRYKFTYNCYAGDGCYGTPTLLSYGYNILYWYLLSCLIILAYGKFRYRK
ncbi:MAG: hypothetical protein U9Q92_02020 [archaeon]|nr:hypothetical protein [archaeon]